jgi:hypothetical protein
VPTPEAVLAGLTRIANEWRWLAVAWHGALFLLLAAFAAGWRPSVRTIGALLAAPVASVGVLAWLSGNPFNGTVFLVLTVMLALGAWRRPDAPVVFDTPAWIARGAVIVAFGAIYPHFVQTTSWAASLVASPFGLVPCPTLAVVAGLTVIIANLRTGRWTMPLFAAGLLYAAFGVFRLGVQLDWGLFIAITLLGVRSAEEGTLWRSVRAGRWERVRPLPGDELIADALGSLTHAITIKRPRAAVWPWLAQMGAGSRAGWYSYDFLDNGRRPSARQVVSALQAVEIGTLFPALPGVTEGFKVLVLEPERSLVLGMPSPVGPPAVTWAFVLENRAGDATRLIVRVRAGQDYRWHGLPTWLSMRLISMVHFVMQRRQLLGIADRAERTEREKDELLDRFIPAYDVVERHRIHVAAPAEITLTAAREQDLLRVPLVRAIFRAREIVMRARSTSGERPRGLLATTLALGWGILAEVPGREVVVGAITKPWEADVTFRALPPGKFAAFAEPGFVKIVWTLRADRVDDRTSIFRTETRAVATDAEATARFRRYWAWASPGIRLIRRLSLRPLRSDAEQRARRAAAL